MHDSVDAVLLRQPDWLREGTLEAAMWANAVLSKTSLVQVLRQKLLRGEPSAQFRSPAPAPSAFGAASFRGETRNIPTRGAVEALVQRRAELLPSHARERRKGMLLRGRLLLFAPQDSLSDGAATVASEGFFDVDNVPAWDTWLYFDGQTLLSWVAHPLISKVQSGIDANPEGCIKWADDGQ
jgi:hypothetical protein